eukprot:scaffold2888_cov274-Pinguiococcus_pyrenoidosus.AAC.13
MRENARQRSHLQFKTHEVRATTPVQLGVGLPSTFGEEPDQRRGVALNVADAHQCFQTSEALAEARGGAQPNGDCFFFSTSCMQPFLRIHLKKASTRKLTITSSVQACICCCTPLRSRPASAAPLLRKEKHKNKLLHAAQHKPETATCDEQRLQINISIIKILLNT